MLDDTEPMPAAFSLKPEYWRNLARRRDPGRRRRPAVWFYAKQKSAPIAWPSSAASYL